MNGDQQPETPPTGWQFNPGDTVAPVGEAPEVPASPVAPVSQAPGEPSVPAPESTAVQPTQQAALPEIQPPIMSKAPVASMPQPMPESQNEAVTWTASEYIANHKTASWYAMLLLGAAALAGLAYLVAQDITSVVSILLIAILFGVYAGRKPRVLAYRLDHDGLTIAQKFYAYGSFRSFAVMDEGAFSSIVLMPLKRFMPLMTIYFTPEDEEKIVNILADRLPMEPHKRDLIDGFMHKIRF